jgi:hypothetical protein
MKIRMIKDGFPWLGAINATTGAELSKENFRALQTGTIVEVDDLIGAYLIALGNCETVADEPKKIKIKKEIEEG